MGIFVIFAFATSTKWRAPKRIQNVILGATNGFGAQNRSKFGASGLEREIGCVGCFCSPAGSEFFIELC